MILRGPFQLRIFYDFTVKLDYTLERTPTFCKTFIRCSLFYFYFFFKYFQVTQTKILTDIASLMTEGSLSSEVNRSYILK